MGAMAATGVAAAAWGYRRSTALAVTAPAPSGDAHLRNPFELREALFFGVLYGVVLVVTRAAQARLGAGGLYASAVLSGLTDVDAVTLSVARLHRGGLTATTATTAILLAAITNTVVKAGIALWAGGTALGRRVVASLGGMLLVGAVVAIATEWLARR